METNSFLLDPPGHLTEGDNSVDALILEARWLLAYQYEYNGRCLQAMRAFSGESTLTISELLTLWDSYNTFMSNKGRQKYFEAKYVIWDDLGI